MTVQTKDVASGDVFIYEAQSPAYTRETKLVTNSGEEEMTLVAGYPMDDNVPVLAATIANTDGVVAEKTVIDAGATAQVPVIVRGDLVINATKLPAIDVAGDALSNATLAAKLATLAGFVVRDEPTTVLEQTT